MNARKLLWVALLSSAFAASACGNTQPDVSEQVDDVLSRPVPMALRLTTIKMNGQSFNAPQSVHVYVTLPGMAKTSTYIGDYAPRPNGSPSTQFNCSNLHVLPGSDGYCTANLPLFSTIGPVKFYGTYPANTNSVAASVQVNGTVTNFTINSTGTSTQTCASAWMTVNNSIDGDKITVCFQTVVAVPFLAPPILETVFYPAPGELSSVGLQQMNTIATKQDWSYQVGSNVSAMVTATFKGVQVGEGLAFQGSTTAGGAQTITSGSAMGFAYRSMTVLPDPSQDLFLIVARANATWLDFHDGTPPQTTVDLMSGDFWALTLAQLRGLAQTPPDASSIDPANQTTALRDINQSTAQQFVAQDPFNSGQPIAQVLANNPRRFIPANPPRVSLVQPTALSPTSQLIKGSETDTYVSQSSGDAFSFSIGPLSFGGTDMSTLTTTYENINQSTATITLQTANPCLEGTADLYMDTAFGAVVPVPHMVDSCNAPTNACSMMRPATFHALTSGQSLAKGQVMTSCNGSWSLSIESDGRLVERYTADNSTPTVFWTPGGTVATMQTNGDFVVKDASGNVLSDSGTSSSSNAFFVLQDDGFLAIYNSGPTPEGGTGGALPPIWTLGPGG
jgi:hypothetical protein